MPEADIIVAPKDAKETSAVLKIANYYEIPVTTWGGGGGTQGGALPVVGGILLDTKRMNKIYDVNTQGMYIECGTGAIYKHIEWAGKRKRLCNDALSEFAYLFNGRRIFGAQGYWRFIDQVRKD